MLKNRTFLGIISIVAALAIIFAISPVMNKVFEGKTGVVVFKTPIYQGQQVTAQNISVVEMSSYNLPSDVISDPKSVIGKYAKTNLYSGNFVFLNMFTDTVDNSDSMLRTLEDNEFAMSVSIKSFASGFSGKLKSGDVIRIVSLDGDKSAIIYDELYYIEVLTTTSESGTDNLNAIPGVDEGADLPVSITVILQDDLQAIRLAECENTSLHAVFVNRDENKKDDYLKKQAEILSALKGVSSDDTEGESDNG